MTISATDVKNLRERTGAGMMDCKKALTETAGNFDDAIEFLKKAGLAKAAKKSSRVAAEGMIFAKITPEKAVLVEVNCETDFVTKNDDFVNFGQKLAEVVYASSAQNLAEANQVLFDGVTVEEKTKSLIAVIGENINFRRTEIWQAKAGQKLGSYNHMNGKIVVITEFSGDLSDDVVRDVCMQVAAMAPQYLDKSEVPQDVLDKEKKIYVEQLQESGKPANAIEGILKGKLDKFAGEMSLLQQVFVKDSKKTVAQYIQDNSANAKIVRFARLAVGEGIEKKEEDFASEVAKIAG